MTEGGIIARGACGVSPSNECKEYFVFVAKLSKAALFRIVFQLKCRLICIYGRNRNSFKFSNAPMKD